MKRNYNEREGVFYLQADKNNHSEVVTLTIIARYLEQCFPNDLKLILEGDSRAPFLAIRTNRGSIETQQTGV